MPLMHTTIKKILLFVLLREKELKNPKVFEAFFLFEKTLFF